MTDAPKFKSTGPEHHTKSGLVRDDQLVPIPRSGLIVLAWFAEWAPEIHKLRWEVRRQWPPGFREMTDVSVYSPKQERAKKDGSYPPILPEDRKAGRDKGSKGPIAARSFVKMLLTYRLLEGTWNVARLTAKGRALLKLRSAEINGYQPPDVFTSHAPDVFDDFDLRPVYMENVRLDFLDKVMQRVPEVYQKASKGDRLPDNELTWRLMTAEYRDEDYRGSGTLNGCTAILTVASGLRPLNGSLRTHHSYPTLRIQDEHHHEIAEVAMSYEALAELLVGNHDVPVTVDSYFGPDGMRRCLPVPPPVSISRRVSERVKRHRQDSLGWLEEAKEIVANTKMGKRVQAEIIDKLNLAIRDVGSEGGYTAELAMEEVSAVAESLLTIMAERTGADRPLLPDGRPASPTALLDGPPEDDPVEVIEAEAVEAPPETVVEEEVPPQHKMGANGEMLCLVEPPDGSWQVWLREAVIAEAERMLIECEEVRPSDREIKLAAAFVKASEKIEWKTAVDVIDVLYNRMDWR